MDKEKKYGFINRLKNPGTIIGIASCIVLILTANHVNVDNERIMTTIKSICSIGVLIGVFNNSETDGIDLPFITGEKYDENKHN